MGIKYKKNPSVQWDRKEETDVFKQDDRMLEIILIQIQSAKRSISAYQNMQERTFIRNKHKELLLAAIDTDIGAGASFDGDEAARIFDLVWDANSSDMGHHYHDNTVKIPLSLLSDEQIENLPKGSFSKEEWESLTDEQREEIEQSTATEKGMVADLADILKGMYSDMEEASERADAEDYIQAEINHLSDRELFDKANRLWKGDMDLMDLMSGFPGIDESDFREQVVEQLRETVNWEQNIEEWEDYEEDFGIYPIPRVLVIPRYFTDLALEAEPHELSQAFKMAAKMYPVNEGLEDDITKGYLSKLSGARESFYDRLDPSHAVYFKPDQDRIEQEIEEPLLAIARADESQFEPEGEEESEEERTLYTFLDGAYVVRLTPEELPKMGDELGFCLGDAEHGYGQKLKKGESAFYAIKTPSGRPKIVIEIALAKINSEPFEVKQIYGKGNRIPGWDLGKIGQGKVKWMEVQKVGKVLELLGFDPTNEEASEYLGSAHRAMHAMDPNMALTQNPKRRRR